jgi:membrane-associated phospholipid phosphatase
MSAKRVSCASLLVLALLASTAHADAWYRGKYGRKRILHLSLSVGFGITYVVGTIGLKNQLTPASCRWCEPPGFDKSARNSLVWNDVKRADFLSTMDAYVLAPIVGGTLLYFSDKDASWNRLLDDTLPVAEAVAISQVLVAGVKFAVGRTRPYGYYNNPKWDQSSSQKYLSFPSGHASLGFALTVGAGTVAHWRGYWTEPYIWASGITISLSVEYLRMAADKHWLSDVLIGGFAGAGAGFLIPTILRKNHEVKIVPVPNGAAVVGMF